MSKGHGCPQHGICTTELIVRLTHMTHHLGIITVCTKLFLKCTSYRLNMKLHCFDESVFKYSISALWSSLLFPKFIFIRSSFLSQFGRNICFCTQIVSYLFLMSLNTVFPFNQKSSMFSSFQFSISQTPHFKWIDTHNPVILFQNSTMPSTHTAENAIPLSTW